MEKSRSEKCYELLDTRYQATIEALDIYGQKISALQKAENSEDNDKAAQIDDARNNLIEARLEKDKIMQEFDEAIKALALPDPPRIDWTQRKASSQKKSIN
eukprot:GEMP01076731.1.p1 GENE.GEMP01076731.1~~GEMP01076731.1.p1  ORF type:complete len:101 (+),score=6.12 GEMP01076731.1:102-404(+)